MLKVKLILLGIATVLFLGEGLPLGQASDSESDSEAPTVVISINSISDDTGDSTIDFVTSDDDGLTIYAKLSSILPSGEILQYSADDGVTWVDITGSVVDYMIVHTDANLTSSTTIKFRVEDLAGNTGPVASQPITIKTKIIKQKN